MVGPASAVREASQTPLVLLLNPSSPLLSQNGNQSRWSPIRGAPPAAPPCSCPVVHTLLASSPLALALPSVPTGHFYSFLQDLFKLFLQHKDFSDTTWGNSALLLYSPNCSLASEGIGQGMYCIGETEFQCRVISLRAEDQAKYLSSSRACMSFIQQMPCGPALYQAP